MAEKSVLAEGTDGKFTITGRFDPRSSSEDFVVDKEARWILDAYEKNEKSRKIDAISEFVILSVGDYLRLGGYNDSDAERTWTVKDILTNGFLQKCQANSSGRYIWRCFPSDVFRLRMRYGDQLEGEKLWVVTKPLRSTNRREYLLGLSHKKDERPSITLRSANPADGINPKHWFVFRLYDSAVTLRDHPRFPLPRSSVG